MFITRRNYKTKNYTDAHINRIVHRSHGKVKMLTYIHYVFVFGKHLELGPLGGL